MRGMEIARSGSMQKRQMEDAVQAKRQMDDYIRQTAAQSSPVDELAKLAQLHDAGTISDSEFEQAKSKLLAA